MVISHSYISLPEGKESGFGVPYFQTKPLIVNRKIPNDLRKYKQLRSGGWKHQQDKNLAY